MSRHFYASIIAQNPILSSLNIATSRPKMTFPKSPADTEEMDLQKQDEF